MRNDLYTFLKASRSFNSESAMASSSLAHVPSSGRIHNFPSVYPRGTAAHLPGSIIMINVCFCGERWRERESEEKGRSKRGRGVGGDEGEYQ